MATTMNLQATETHNRLGTCPDCGEESDHCCDNCGCCGCSGGCGCYPAELETAVETLAYTCAETAWQHRTEDADGTVICSDGPLPGDWEALDDLLGGRMSDEQRAAYTCETQTAFRREYEWHMRGLRDGSVTPAPAAPERDFSGYFAATEADQIERAEIQG